MAIDANSDENWASEYGQQRRITTLLTRSLTAAQLSKVTAAIAANHLNIDVITKLSGRVTLDDPVSLPKACAKKKIYLITSRIVHLESSGLLK